MTFDILYIISIILGVGMLLGVLLKPKFFWDTERVKHARKMFGDQKTGLMYALLGVIMILVGLAATFNLF